MKNFIFILILFLTIISSCSRNKEIKEKQIQDSILISDSTTTAYQDSERENSIREDSIREDSLINIQIEEQFKNPLTMTKGKANKKWIGDQTDPNISVPVIIKNNTDITIKPNDYSIAYTYSYTAGVDEDGDGFDDYIDFFDKKANRKGVEIAPHESVTITISKECVTDITNIKLKSSLKKDEFEKRFREMKSQN